MSQTLTILNQTGPGAGGWYCAASSEDYPDEARIVSIIGKSPSWGSADVKIQTTFDPSASPEDVQPMQVQSGTTTADAVFEADFSVQVLLVPGEYFRISVADTGSPLTALTVKARGPVVAYEPSA